MAQKCFKAILIDLSGTLHIENSVIPGAVEALQRLRSRNIKIRFVTNTTKESKRILFERLSSLGFLVKDHEIFTSLTAARELIEQKNLRPLLFLEEEALEDFEDGPRFSRKRGLNAEGIETKNPNAVAIGLAPSKFNYENLTSAFRLLLSGATLIAIHKGRYYKKQDGLALGPGPFVAALEYAADVRANIVGKPESSFFLEGLRPLDCSPSDSIMIGDDVRDDIDGAQKAGITGILVKTGKYRAGDETKIQPPPSHVFDNFPAAVDFIMDKLI